MNSVLGLGLVIKVKAKSERDGALKNILHFL